MNFPTLIGNNVPISISEIGYTFAAPVPPLELTSLLKFKELTSPLSKFWRIRDFGEMPILTKMEGEPTDS